ncbi:ABC transporter ATP-binding protein [Streptoalloteichus hindustanus]|uniref:ATP-binding cassette, subfamily B n=1 Tax=Streptoalloteichus hindustanus TaxID=2017 RepID=A0A1M5PIZ6_STRHI|nr:ABC transporter ATP-binding protein [Streptoalloteichus hindustanus]SHH01675.1 ATP-binding cassette, subfamily B [Streptoalloteichus hindustanus]
MATRPDRGARRAQRSTLAVLRRLGPYLRPIRGALALAIVAALAANLAGLSIPLVLQRVLDGPVAQRDLGALPPLLLAILALGVAEAGLFWLRRRVLSRPITGLEQRMRADLYRHLQGLPVAFHDRWQSGQLLSRATGDLATVRRFMNFSVVFLLANTFVLVAGLLLLLWLSPALAAVQAVAVLPLVALVSVYENRYRVVARQCQDQEGDLATTVEESVLGVRVLRAFGRGPHLTRRFVGQARELRWRELRRVRLLAVLWTICVVLPELVIAGQLALGGYAVAQGAMTVGTLVAAITATSYLEWPIQSLGWMLAEANNAAAACERIWEVFDAPLSIADPERPRALAPPTRGHLRFEGVRFAHPGADGDLLRGVDLEVRPGETVALVGATGCGKTALTALVPRLHDVTGGRVLVDGVDVRELPVAELRRVVGTAFEDPVLFSASVRENVKLGVPEATDEQVWAALRVAHAAEFVAALPWGLSTRIGEQGLSLSGGQRQRLALARAVLGRPAVLVLDDPLSALDVHTEAEVEAALRQVLRDATALVVAHRPSTVRLADRVALLSGGRVVAVGTHEELSGTCREYRALMSTVDGRVDGHVDGKADGRTAGQRPDSTGNDAGEVTTR